MKRYICLFLALVLLLGLAGCKQYGGNKVSNMTPDELAAEALQYLLRQDVWSFRYELTERFHNNGQYTNYREVEAALSCTPALSMFGWIQTTQGGQRFGVYLRESENGTALERLRSDSEQSSFDYLRLTAQGTASGLEHWKYGLGYGERYGSDEPKVLEAADNVVRLLAAGTDFRELRRETYNGRAAICLEGSLKQDRLYAIMNACNVWQDCPVTIGEEYQSASVPILLWVVADTAEPLRIEADFTALMQQQNKNYIEQTARQQSMQPSSPSYDELRERLPELVSFEEGRITVNLDAGAKTVEIPQEYRQEMDRASRQ